MRVTFAQTPGEEDRLSYEIWQKPAPGRGDSRAKIPQAGLHSVYSRTARESRWLGEGELKMRRRQRGDRWGDDQILQGCWKMLAFTWVNEEPFENLEEARLDLISVLRTITLDITFRIDWKGKQGDQAETLTRVWNRTSEQRSSYDYRWTRFLKREELNILAAAIHGPMGRLIFCCCCFLNSSTILVFSNAGFQSDIFGLLRKPSDLPAQWKWRKLCLTAHTLIFFVPLPHTRWVSEKGCCPIQAPRRKLIWIHLKGT